LPICFLYIVSLIRILDFIFLPFLIFLQGWMPHPVLEISIQNEILYQVLCVFFHLTNASYLYIGRPKHLITKNFIFFENIKSWRSLGFSETNEENKYRKKKSGSGCFYSLSFRSRILL